MLDEKKIREQYDTEIKNIELQRDYLLNKIKTLNKCKDAAEGNINLEELNSLLCYKNLAFCCRPKTSEGSGKKCMWRDTVLAILDISKEDFIRIKEKAANIFYYKIGKKE